MKVSTASVSYNRISCVHFRYCQIVTRCYIPVEGGLSDISPSQWTCPRSPDRSEVFALMGYVVPGCVEDLVWRLCESYVIVVTAYSFLLVCWIYSSYTLCIEFIQLIQACSIYLINRVCIELMQFAHSMLSLFNRLSQSDDSVRLACIEII